MSTGFSLSLGPAKSDTHLQILLCDLVMHVCDHDPSVVLVVITLTTAAASTQQLDAASTTTIRAVVVCGVKIVCPCFVS